MTLDELFVIAALAILIVVSLPVFLLEAFLIIAHIIEDKECRRNYGYIPHYTRKMPMIKTQNSVSESVGKPFIS